MNAAFFCTICMLYVSSSLRVYAKYQNCFHLIRLVIGKKKLRIFMDQELS